MLVSKRRSVLRARPMAEPVDRGPRTLLRTNDAEPGPVTECGAKI
jgi:hypothetical protein